jgi:hypothetical protein
VGKSTNAPNASRNRAGPATKVARDSNSSSSRTGEISRTASRGITRTRETTNRHRTTATRVVPGAGLLGDVLPTAEIVVGTSRRCRVATPTPAASSSSSRTGSSSSRSPSSSNSRSLRFRSSSRSRLQISLSPLLPEFLTLALSRSRLRSNFAPFRLKLSWQSLEKLPAPIVRK